MTRVCFTDVGFPTNIVISNAIDQKRTGIFTLDEVVFGAVSSQVIPVVARMFPAWQFVVTQIHMEGRDANRKVYPTWITVSEKGVSRGRISIRHPWRSYSEDLVFENPRIYSAMERVGHKTTTKPKVAVQIIKQYFTDPPMTEQIKEAARSMRVEASQRKAMFKATRDSEYMKFASVVQSYVEENLLEIAKQVPAVGTNFNVPAYLNLVEDAKISASVIDAPTNSTLTVMLHDDKYVLHRSNMPIYALTSEHLPTQVRTAVGLLKLIEDGQFVRDVGYRYKANKFLVVYGGPLDEETACKTSN
jgi:hypothetical protein